MSSTYSSLNVHLVFATKNRAPMIDRSWQNELHAYLAGSATRLGTHVFAIGGVEDHVHVLVGYRTSHCVADIVREVKKSSTAWASERYSRFAWQVGYGAFTLNRSAVDGVCQYIARQEEHHRTVSSADELRALLAEFEIPYDEKYFE